MREIGLGWILLAGAAYGASLVTTSLAWPAILTKLGTHLPLRTAVGIGLLAQIGKYLPGNVAHYVGRAALASRRSVSLGRSGTSTGVEFCSALIAAGLTIVLMAALQPEMLARAGAQIGNANFYPALAAASLTLAGAVLLARRTRWLAPVLKPSLWLRPVFFLFLSFLLAGLSFHATAVGIAPSQAPGLAGAVALYAFAWTAGFLVPGAPAGLGVREAVIVGVLGSTMGATAALLCALVHRLVSAVADGSMALVGAGLLMNRKEVHAR